MSASAKKNIFISTANQKKNLSSILKRRFPKHKPPCVKVRASTVANVKSVSCELVARILCHQQVPQTHPSCVCLPASPSRRPLAPQHTGWWECCLGFAGLWWPEQGGRAKPHPISSGHFADAAQGRTKRSDDLMQLLYV